MLTPTDIRSRLPEFEALSTECIQTALDEAVIVINPEQWANKFDLGVLYYVGHTLSIAGGNTAPNAPTSEKVGDVSASYAVSGEISSSGFGSSVYGRKYIEIRRVCFASRIM